MLVGSEDLFSRFKSSEINVSNSAKFETNMISQEWETKKNINLVNLLLST